MPFKFNPLTGSFDQVGSPAEVAGADRNVYVGTTEYATVQSAVNYAETLAGSAITDEQGITVHVPAGYYNETVTIKKNVNLVGAGKFATKIESLVYRPSSSSSGPRKTLVSGMRIMTLTVSNETAAASGVFYADMLGLTGHFVKTSINTADITGIINADFYLCELTQVNSTNANVEFDFSYVQNITHIMDETAASYIPANTNSCYLFQCYAPGDVIVTTTSSVLDVSYLASRNSYIGYLTENDNTATNIQGGMVFERTLNGATHLGSTYRGFCQLQSYAKLDLPAASSANTGLMVYVNDEAGGAVPAFSDGTNWRRVTDRAVVS